MYKNKKSFNITLIYKYYQERYLRHPVSAYLRFGIDNVMKTKNILRQHQIQIHTLKDT